MERGRLENMFRVGMALTFAISTAVLSGCRQEEVPDPEDSPAIATPLAKSTTLLTPNRPFTESVELKTRIRETYHAHP